MYTRKLIFEKKVVLHRMASAYFIPHTPGPHLGLRTILKLTVRLRGTTPSTSARESAWAHQIAHTKPAFEGSERWSATRSSKINVHHVTDFGAKCGTNVVKQHPKMEGCETLVLQRVLGLIDPGLAGSGGTRAENTGGSPPQSHKSSSIHKVYED